MTTSSMLRLNSTLQADACKARLSHPFAPIIDSDSKILILGTFPSTQSFKNSFYYAHPRNQFWRLLAKAFDDEEPKTIEEKRAFLKRHHIALWDIVKGCERQNSLDSSLKNVEVNDIEELLKRYPNIKAIFFTGRKAQQLFERHFNHLDILRFYLPSPSPAYMAMSFEKKAQEYKKALGLFC